KRRQVLESLKQSSPSPMQSWVIRGLDWLRRPDSLALSGSLASGLVAVIALAYLLFQVGPKTTEPLLTADARRSVSSTREARSSAPVKQASPKAKTSSAQSLGGLRAEKTAERTSQPAAEPTKETSANT